MPKWAKYAVREYQDETSRKRYLIGNTPKYLREFRKTRTVCRCCFAKVKRKISTEKNAESR